MVRIVTHFRDANGREFVWAAGGSDIVVDPHGDQWAFREMVQPVAVIDFKVVVEDVENPQIT